MRINHIHSQALNDSIIKINNTSILHEQTTELLKTSQGAIANLKVVAIKCHDSSTFLNLYLISPQKVKIKN